MFRGKGDCSVDLSLEQLLDKEILQKYVRYLWDTRICEPFYPVINKKVNNGNYVLMFESYAYTPIYRILTTSQIANIETLDDVLSDLCNCEVPISDFDDFCKESFGYTIGFKNDYIKITPKEFFGDTKEHLIRFFNTNKPEATRILIDIKEDDNTYIFIFQKEGKTEIVSVEVEEKDKISNILNKLNFPKYNELVEYYKKEVNRQLINELSIETKPKQLQMTNPTNYPSSVGYGAGGTKPTNPNYHYGNAGLNWEEKVPKTPHVDKIELIEYVF